MTLQTMWFIFGALLLAVAILGGALEVKEIKVSNVTKNGRILAGVVGLVFVALGFWQPISSTIPDIPARSPATPIAPTATMSEREHDKDRYGGDYLFYDISIRTTSRIARAPARPTRNAPLGLMSSQALFGHMPSAPSRVSFLRFRTMYAAFLAPKFADRSELSFIKTVAR
jgi:hypothetical protein